MSFAPPLRAESLDLSFGLLSDKVTRGYSKSQGRTTLEVDGVYRFDNGWFIGLGATDQRSRSASGRVEILASVGVVMPLDEDWTLQAALARYEHAGGRRIIDTDYTDVTLSADWRGRGNVLVTVSPDTRTGSRSGWTAIAEAAWHQPLAERWAIDAGIGRIDRSGIGSVGYGYGSVGLSLSAGPVRLFATRIFSQAVSSGAFPPGSQASKWVLAVVVVR